MEFLAILALAAAAAEPVPLLSAPFSGEFGVGGFFDHGGPSEQVQLTFRGTHAYGRAGHHGLDFSLPRGTPVLAAAAGRVVTARDQGAIECPEGQRPARSLIVRVLHEDAPDGHDYVTAYLHLDDFVVRDGEEVVAGQLLGHSGSTGCSQGPHLHFGVIRVTDPVRLKRVPVDPYGWTGDGSDPRASEAQSVWLWKPGAEPRLRRYGRKGRSGGELGLARVLATDLVDPLGEWVEVVLAESAAGPASLEGLSLLSDAGNRVPLPAATLAPGEVLRVWTRRPTTETGGLSLDLDRPLWADTGDCVRLVDAAGLVVGTVPFGRGRARAPGCSPTRTPAEVTAP